MKKFDKLIIFIAVLCIAAGTAGLSRTMAAPEDQIGDIILSVNNTKPAPGAEVEVSVRFSAEKALPKLDATISWHAGVMDFVSASKGNNDIDVINQGGAVKFEYSNASGTNSGNLGTLKFKVKSNAASGSVGKVNATSASAFDKENEPYSLNKGETALTVTAPSKSNNTNLRSVTVGTTNITGTQVGNTFSHTYPTGIGFANIFVTPEDGKASVTIDGKSSGTQFNFNFGQNSFPVRVTAEDGTVKNYDIIVVRSGGSIVDETPAPTPSAETPTPGTTATPTPTPPNQSPTPGNGTPDPGDGTPGPGETPDGTPGNGDEIENNINTWSIIVWSGIALIVGVWIGIFIGYMIWGKKKKKRLFRY